MARWNQRSIYRVPEFIKKLSNSDAYRPHFISLGPYHHGEPHLLPMEEHKRLAVLHMVKQASKPLQEFVAVIEDVVDELQCAYGDLDDKWRGANKGRFVEMVEGGCFVLEFIRAKAIRSEGKEDMEILGFHFLGILHKGYCGISPHWEGMDIHHPRTPSAVELNQAGIQFKKSNTDSIHDVDFKNGVLSMKVFKFYDSTELELLNLMAFEWLHPDAKQDVRSYISFLDNIIESETQHRHNRLGQVKWTMNAHCSKHRNKWGAIFVNNYLSNPWVFISLVAAVIPLIATIVQTIYTIVPFYTKKS
uniref:Uncharacterized protein n=1 Tax=Setaria italica TaxID=4555 RepID=K3ZNJ5_SETIT